MSCRLVPLIFVNVVAACLVAGCGDRSRDRQSSDYGLDAVSFDSGHLKLVETKSGIVLPADSRGRHLRWLGRQLDPGFVAKIAIASNSAASFTRQLDQLPSQTIQITGSATSGTAWWRPSKAVAVEKTFIRAGCYEHLILCDEDGSWFLYLEWVSM